METILPTYYYETFRIVGFPAIASHHATLGVGYVFSHDFEIHVAYVHGFKETFTQTGTDVLGNPAVLESSVTQNSLDFGLQWRF
jgi:long-chain fatty acid transport protein